MSFEAGGYEKQLVRNYSDVKARLWNLPKKEKPKPVEIIAEPIPEPVEQLPEVIALVEEVSEPEAVIEDLPVKLLMVNDVIVHVAKHYGFRVSEMLSIRRFQRLAHARQVAMWLAKELTARSFPYIGKRLGGRDHTTVMHGIKVIERMRRNDPEFSAELDSLKAALTGNSDGPDNPIPPQIS